MAFMRACRLLYDCAHCQPAALGVMHGKDEGDVRLYLTVSACAQARPVLRRSLRTRNVATGRWQYCSSIWKISPGVVLSLQGTKTKQQLSAHSTPCIQQALGFISMCVHHGAYA